MTTLEDVFGCGFGQSEGCSARFWSKDDESGEWRVGNEQKIWNMWGTFRITLFLGLCFY